MMLLYVVSGLYFFFFKSYRKPLQKLIVTAIIIAHIVANPIK
jgi:hypothetical protein